MWYLAIAVTTDGLTPSPRPSVVKTRIASNKKVLPAISASFSWIPSKRPIGTPNCSRTKEYSAVDLNAD